MNIKVRKIDKDNLPFGEVLANDNSNNLLLGFIVVKDGEIFCENDNRLLKNPTFYIEDFDLMKAFNTVKSNAKMKK